MQHPPYLKFFLKFFFFLLIFFPFLFHLNPTHALCTIHSVAGIKEIDIAVQGPLLISGAYCILCICAMIIRAGAGRVLVG